MVNVIAKVTLNGGINNQPTFQHYCLLQGVLAVTLTTLKKAVMLKRPMIYTAIKCHFKNNMHFYVVSSMLWALDLVGN